MYISRRFQGHLVSSSKQEKENKIYYNTWYGGEMGCMVPLLDMCNHK